MAKEISKQALTVFEQIKQKDENGNEFWSGRDLAKVLDYAEYRNFKPVIDKAKEASAKEVVALGQTYFAVQTRLQEIQQMDEYNRLSTENEKRIFLRNELAKHNTNLAAAAKSAG